MMGSGHSDQCELHVLVKSSLLFVCCVFSGMVLHVVDNFQIAISTMYSLFVYMLCYLVWSGGFSNLMAGFGAKPTEPDANTDLIRCKMVYV